MDIYWQLNPFPLKPDGSFVVSEKLSKIYKCPSVAPKVHSSRDWGVSPNKKLQYKINVQKKHKNKNQITKFYLKLFGQIISAMQINQKHLKASFHFFKTNL